MNRILITRPLDYLESMLEGLLIYLLGRLGVLVAADKYEGVKQSREEEVLHPPQISHIAIILIHKKAKITSYRCLDKDNLSCS
jgi:hypothetical protein